MVDTASANATAPGNVNEASAQAEANVGGRWFGNPGTSSNGHAAYSQAMGLPSTAVQARLVNAAATPTIEASFNASGSGIFGAGVLGANYSTHSAGTVTYVATNTHDYNLGGTNTFTLGLLTMGAYNGGFTSLSFTVKDGATTLLPTKIFTSLSSAEAYFTDDPVSLGTISGSTDLTLTYKLTANAPEGAGISYVVAVAPAGATSGPARSFSALNEAGLYSHRLTIGSDPGAKLTAILAGFNSHYAEVSSHAADASSASRQLADPGRSPQFFRIVREGLRR